MKTIYAAALAVILIASSPALANSTSDKLASMPATKQAEILGQVVGEGCVGKTAFYQGDSNDGSSFWNVRCTNRRSYSVMIYPDAHGSTKVLDCQMMRAVAQTECFVRFDAQ